ncbi:MAG: lysozyme inhibitor LprI family protein [Pseudomonadota bacterium]
MQFSSQVEIGQCLIDAETHSEAALDIAMDIARENAADLDEVTRRDVALPALEASHTAWLAFREAECDYAGALSGGGSGTGITIRSCRIEKTRTRITDLMGRL